MCVLELFDKPKIINKITTNAAINKYFESNHFKGDRKSTRLNSSHWNKSRMPSSA